MAISGFININKNSGPTSHDMVVKVRESFVEKVKVGHLGTLDPLAEGVLPIAVGTAMSLKLKKDKSSKVFCFMGDMTAETGIAHESIKYSRNFKLPIHFIVEDNEKSVCTDTRESWGKKKLSFEKKNDKYVTYYKYQTSYPHAGAGVRVQF